MRGKFYFARLTNRIAYIVIFHVVLITISQGICKAGEDWTPQPIGPFSGLNDRDNSFAIPAQNASSILNVNITPGGKSVFKRKGYGLGFTLTNTTSPVHGVYTFFDSNGNTVDLFANDTYLSASISAASPNVIFSTGPNGATYQCTDNLGFAYCANTSRTTLIKTNGSTYSLIQNVSSTGTMVATAVTRLAMAGFSDRPSGIDFSADSDFTSWGTGSLGSSPVQLTVSAPGARITGIVYAFGRLMWFKNSSFGYILIGNQPLQTDWVIGTVAYDVGTNDNTFVYREGILYFRGQDGHIYSFDGSSYQRLSREIAATINLSQIRSANSWTQTSAADFASGSFSPVVYADTISANGDLYMTFPDSFARFNSGTSGTKPIWAEYDSGTLDGTQTINSDGSQLFIRNGGNSTGRVNLSSNEQLTDFKQGTTYHFIINQLPVDSAHLSDLYFTLRPTKASASGNPDASGAMVLDIESTTTSRTTIANLTIASMSGATSTSVDYAQPTTVDIFFSTTIYQISLNNVVALSGTHSATTGPQYLYIGYLNGEVGTKSCFIDNFAVIPETMTYQSAVKNAPNLSSWDAFTATKFDSTNGYGGSHTFFIRSASAAFSVNSSTPAWTALSNNSIPTVSTNSYFQIRDDMKLSSFNAASITSNLTFLSDFTQNWFEGNASDKSYATYFDDKIWWEVASGVAAITNNKTLIYDILNKTWVIYDLAANGFLVRTNKLYFGSAAGGYTYKFGDVDNDNGSAINAYWKSKDFYGGSPFGTQELSNISFANKTVANSSMTVTYTINGTTSTSYTFPTGSSTNNFIGKNKNLPAGLTAGTYSIQFGNNAADQPFEVFAVQVGIRPKSWVPN